MVEVTDTLRGRKRIPEVETQETKVEELIFLKPRHYKDWHDTERYQEKFRGFANCYITYIWIFKRSMG